MKFNFIESLLNNMTCEQQNYDNFKKILQDSDFDSIFLEDIPVAKTIGDLLIKRKSKTQYIIEYTPNKLFSIFEGQTWLLENVDEVIDVISNLPKSIYVNTQDLLSPKELHNYQNQLDCIFYYWKDISPYCYLCGEYAYGLRTECGKGHTICIYCKNKKNTSCPHCKNEINKKEI